MNIAGLYKLIDQLRQQAKWNRAKAAAPSADPRVAYEAEVSAKDAESRAEELEAHAKGNQDMILNIESLIHYLNHSPHKSADRTIATRHLEDASMRLRRELGDPV